MKLLAIDTALEACSVAVAAGDDEPVVISETIGRGHAERLFGMIEAAMAEAGLSFAELARIAVTVGPGSFTGLRVGIAAARGLALVVKCPVVGLGTLAVHAEAARAVTGAVPVLALLDARRDEFYGQRFAADGTAAGLPAVGSAAYFAAWVEPGDVLAGSGADGVAAALSKGFAPIAHRASAPDLRALVRLALRAPVTVAPPRPLYLRPPDAKPQPGKRVAQIKSRGRPQAGPGAEIKRRGAPSGATGKETKSRGAPSSTTGKETKRRGAPSGVTGKETDQ